MGIKGIYHEIGPGDRIALSKLAVEFFEKTGRPLRLAIDISIWLFQIQAGEGGTNPALRTFYYRILRLISLSIHPLFVFDGPNKPPFKRNKRTMAPGVKTVSIPEFLAKQLLKHFALPTHLAPGEAEAECALLQQLGYVDAVLSEDADTLMFGSGLTLRNLSPEGSLKTSAATHVNVYEAQKVKDSAGLDREGMILVALMSGGDYIPEGIPGCGPKTACQAARAGFGSELCKIERDDRAGFAAWKDRLAHELHTNKSKIFSKKKPTLQIPEDFPRRDVLRFYTHPCVSSDRALAEQLPDELKWDRDIDIQALRNFAGEAFEWFYLSGAKKFVRNLAPALLVKELRLRGSASVSVSDSPSEIEQQESNLIKSIHLKRNHVSTDQTTELRVGFVPIDLVKLDLRFETPDPEITDDIELDEEDIITAAGNEEPSSPKKKRGPSKYDPISLEKIWVLESYLKIGVPVKVQDWEESSRNAQKAKESKQRDGKSRNTPSNTTKGSMPIGSLDRFAKVTKPALSQPKPIEPPQPVQSDSIQIHFDHASNLSMLSTSKTLVPMPSRPAFRAPRPIPGQPLYASESTTIEILSSPEQRPQRRRRSLSHSRASIIEFDVKLSAIQRTGSDDTAKEHPSSSRTGIDPKSENLTSITTRRRRSPLQRAKTSSSYECQNPKMREHMAPRLAQIAFRKPPDLPRSFAQGVDSAQHAVSPVPIPLPPQRPSTPTAISNPRTTRGQLIETINLCSSPVTPKHRQSSMTEWVSASKPDITVSASPSTPRTRQRSITEWVSPSKTPVAASKAARLSPETRNGDADAATESLHIVEPEARDLGQNQPLAATSSSLLNTCLPLQPRRERHVRLSKAAESTGNVIRLRESLDGAWQISKSSSTSHPGTLGADEEDPQGKKRKRTEWRVSQVEVLDLTQI